LPVEGLLAGHRQDQADLHRFLREGCEETTEQRSRNQSSRLIICLPSQQSLFANY
jgi:hypothetical protein